MTRTILIPAIIPKGGNRRPKQNIKARYELTTNELNYTERRKNFR
jgi:hypothetical protein